MGPRLIAFAIPLFFVGIGVEWFVSRRKRRPVYRLGDALGDLGCGVAQQLTSLAVTGLVLGSYGVLYEHRLVTLPSGWATWVIAFVGVEFAYYWWHRLSHGVNVLWAAHVVHHQSEDYNLAVALRQSVSTWATSLLFYVPLAPLGVPPLHFAVAVGVSTLYQFWIHTELVPKLGPLEWLFNTPSHHRVHHAINPQYLDKNHGGIVIVFDRLFGTFKEEQEPCIYGTTRPLGTFNPLWAQVDTAVELLQLARRAPTVLDAVRVFFASPAWRPDWMGEAAKRDPARKYDPPAPRAVQTWALAQWAVLMVFVFLFILFGAQLLLGWRLLGAALILLGLASLTGLVEGKRWASGLERFRLAATVLSVAAYAAVAIR